MSSTYGEGGPPRALALILARQLAENLATPMFLVDERGMLVFWNEAADSIVGRSYNEVGEVPVADWGVMLEPTDLAGERINRANVPTGIAFLERRPAHQKMMAKGMDGVHRCVEVTAYPLFSRADEFAGCVTIFWESEEPADRPMSRSDVSEVT